MSETVNCRFHGPQNEGTPVNNNKSSKQHLKINKTKPKTNLTNKQQIIIFLVFGYCKAHSINKIPTDIIQLIHKFYEATFYWRVEGDEMDKFLNAKNGDVIHSKSTIIIRDIEFEVTLCPNGWRRRSEGGVEVYCEMKYVPDDVKYFTVRVELNCETTNIKRKVLRIWRNKGDGNGVLCCKLDECQDMEHIDFNCFVNLLHVKYEEDSNNTDFVSEIKMKTHVEHEWIISDKQEMKKLRNMHEGMTHVHVCGNWKINFAPRASSAIQKSSYPGKPNILVSALSIPFGVMTMTCEYHIELSCKSNTISWIMRTKIIDFLNRGTRMDMQCSEVDVDELLNEEWIKISIIVQIKSIADFDNQPIPNDEWSKYGIFD